MKKALIALLFGLLTIPALADNTIVENLQELIETRDAITNAIVQKGGTVTSGALTNVPNEILSIPSGGGDNTKLLEIVQRTATEITVNDLTNCVDIGRSSLSWLTHLTSIEIPSTVTNIGPYAFQGDKELKQITIPDSVEYFADTSIRDCWTGGLVVDFGGTRETIPFLTKVSASSSPPPSRTKVLVPEALMEVWKQTNGWQTSSIWYNAIRPHLDFNPALTYVVNAQGQVVYSELVSGRLTNDIIDNWVNEGVEFDGTETIVIGLGVQNITADGDYLDPTYFPKLEFLNRIQSDIERWSNYPWNYATNSTLLFLDSSIDHTVK